MRIHSDTLSAMHIIHAVQSIEGVNVGRIEKHGSRSRKTSFDLFLTGHSISGGQWGNTNGEKTASWDDWGMVLGALYLLDPQMIAGPYKNADNFHHVTGERFTGGPFTIHHRHRWEYAGHDGIERYFTCKGTKAIECKAEMVFPSIASAA